MARFDFKPEFEGDVGLYDEKYLEYWYNEGGMQKTILGELAQGGDKFTKAIGNWDAPTSPYGEYFESVFSSTVYGYTWNASEVYKLLPKTRFVVEGDSLKYYETDLSTLQGVTHASTPFASGSAESGPTVVSLEGVQPAYLVDPWSTSLMSRTQSMWQNDPKLNPEWLKKYHTMLLPHQLDAQLTLNVDTISNDGSSNLNLESIDRIVSCDNESNTTYLNVATDGDLHWGNTSALIDRDADTDNTFGGGGGTAGDGISLPGSAAARVLSLDYIDDVVTAIKKYSTNKRYIAITGAKTINEMQKLIDPKQRFLESEMNVSYTVNGVQTRKGVDTGFTVASYAAGGIRIPFFESNHISGEAGANLGSKVTDADIGNIYFLDLDAIELREAIPITYMETPPPSMLVGDVMQIRHWYLYAAQLFATEFRPHGAVKYLKST